MPSGAGPSMRLYAQPLDLRHRSAIDRALAGLRRSLGECALSDLTFGNLYLFRAAHEYRYLPGDLPCVAGRTYDGTAHLLPLFELAEVRADLLAALLEPGECFYPLPAQTVARLDAVEFESAALPQDSDYLYRAGEFVEYRNKALRGQRMASRRLAERHAVTVCDVRHDGGADALAVLDRWRIEKQHGPREADVAPCREAIRPPRDLVPLAGSVFYVDRQPAGFLLTEELNPQVRAVRFAKGLAAFNGIYPYMFQQLCRSNRDAVQWLNFEQDLGKPNFPPRQAGLLPGPAAGEIPRSSARCRLFRGGGLALQHEALEQSAVVLQAQPPGRLVPGVGPIDGAMQCELGGARLGTQQAGRAQSSRTRFQVAK